MTKEDLQQIGDLMDTKLDKALKDNNLDLHKEFTKLLENNNKLIIEEINDKIIPEFANIVSTAFSEFEGKVNERFDRVDERFARVEERLDTLTEDMKYIKEEVSGVKHDVTLLKYFHIKDFKSAPDSLTVISELADADMN